MLVLVFGMSVFAVSTVLTAFMAGLALGSIYFGRVVDRKGNGLRIYALLELGIGAFALVVPFIFSGLDDVYTFLYHRLQGMSYAFSLIRFLLSFLVLLVPTILMGATLPVLSKVVVRRLAQIGWNVGALYAINTFGGAIGCFGAAFVLMEHLGISGTTYLAAGVNLLIAGIAFWWSRRARPSTRCCGG
jgi:spermidine synthase